jgi:hypothetical protein
LITKLNKVNIQIISTFILVISLICIIIVLQSNYVNEESNFVYEDVNEESNFVYEDVHEESSLKETKNEESNSVDEESNSHCRKVVSKYLLKYIEYKLPYVKKYIISVHKEHYVKMVIPLDLQGIKIIERIENYEQQDWPEKVYVKEYVIREEYLRLLKECKKL